MDEYIEMKALREAFDNADADVVEEYEDGGSDWGFSRQNILEVINSVPAADVAPVRHGRWGVDGVYVVCSVCNRFTLSPIVKRLQTFKYCPNCGAKMDLEVQDGKRRSNSDS